MVESKGEWRTACTRTQTHAGKVGVCGYGRGEIGERGETLGHNTDKPAEERERVESTQGNVLLDVLIL